MHTEEGKSGEEAAASFIINLELALLSVLLLLSLLLLFNIVVSLFWLAR